MPLQTMCPVGPRLAPSIPTAKLPGFPSARSPEPLATPDKELFTLCHSPIDIENENTAWRRAILFDPPTPSSPTRSMGDAHSSEEDEPLCALPLDFLPPMINRVPRLKRQKTTDGMLFKPPRCELALLPYTNDYPSLGLLKHISAESQAGMRIGCIPVLAPMSVGGAYFLRNRIGHIMAVMKPMDEEPFAANNPRDYRGGSLGMKNGIPAGEAAIREVAAFVIDNGFSRVPPTAMVSLNHPIYGNEKVGSLQSYVRNDGCSEDWGASRFNLEDAQRIAILDIRLLNQDRHAGNILVEKAMEKCSSDHPGLASMWRTQQLERRESGETDTDWMSTTSSENENLPVLYKLRRSHSVGPSIDITRRQALTPCPRRRVGDGMRLVPIDHGFCLPHPLAVDETELAWMGWPQAKVPLSNELKEFVASINVDEDIARVEALLGDLLPTHCLLTLRIGTELLQAGTAQGLTLYEIAHIIVRENFDRPSLLEWAIDETYRKLSGGAGCVGRSTMKNMDHQLFMANFQPNLVTVINRTKDRRLIRSVSA